MDETKSSTQRELAKDLGISPIYLNAILRGRERVDGCPYRPSAKLALRIEAVMGVPKESLRPDIWPASPPEPQA